MAEPYDTDWSSVPDTDKNAVAIRLGKAPKGREIVRIQNGRIRCATVSGYFVVADVLKPDTWRGKKRRLQVECLWYGKKPPTTWMHITINDAVVTRTANFDGKVVRDIGRSERKAR